MPILSSSNFTLLVRTDFADDSQWRALIQAVATESADGFRAYVEAVDDVDFSDAEWRTVRAALTHIRYASVLLVADRIALGSPDFPILVVDALRSRSPFRCIASELWSAENNLNLANMDWEDFTRAADEHGVFRGF